MTSADKINQAFKQLNAKSTPALRERILSDAQQAMGTAISASASRPGAGRIVTANRFAKFAAAAAIIGWLVSLFFQPPPTIAPSEMDTSPVYILSNAYNNPLYSQEIMPCNVLPIVPD